MLKGLNQRTKLKESLSQTPRCPDAEFDIFDMIKYITVTFWLLRKVVLGPCTL